MASNKYLKIQEWQVKEIKQGIIEADAGLLIEHENIVKRWKKKRAHSHLLHGAMQWPENF